MEKEEIPMFCEIEGQMTRRDEFALSVLCVFCKKYSEELVDENTREYRIGLLTDLCWKIADTMEEKRNAKEST